MAKRVAFQSLLQKLREPAAHSSLIASSLPGLAPRARVNLVASAPNLSTHTVIQTQKVPAQELFNSRYRYTTLLLLAVWFFGYSGIVYGGASFFPTWAVANGWSAHQLFFVTRILAVPIVVGAFFLVSLFGEKLERKTWLVIGSAIYSICFLLLLVILTIIEEAVVGLFHHRSIADSLGDLFGARLEETLAGYLIMLLVLIPYFAFQVLDDALGKGRLVRMFFVEREPMTPK